MQPGLLHLQESFLKCSGPESLISEKQEFQIGPFRSVHAPSGKTVINFQPEIPDFHRPVDLTMISKRPDLRPPCLSVGMI
jgi:hypothetical protein